MVSHCCFCIDLKVGSLVIGYFYLITEIAGLLVGAALYFSGPSVKSGPSGELSDLDRAKAADNAAMLVIFIIIAVVVSIYLLFTALLLIGIHKNVSGCITAFIVFDVITIGFSILGMIGSVFQIHGFIDFIVILVNLLSLSIHVHFLLVIRSYQKTMERGSAQVGYTA